MEKAIETKSVETTVSEIMGHLMDASTNRPSTLKLSFWMEDDGLHCGALCGRNPSYRDDAPWAGYIHWDMDETTMARQMDRLAWEITKAMTRIHHIQDGNVVHACPDCGMVVGRWNEEYVSQYPNGFEMAIEQAMMRHHSGECPNSHEWDTVVTCPHCGEEIGAWDYEYTSRHPNGFEMAVSQAREQHEQGCPVLVEQAWEDWREAAKANEEETPRQLLARRYSEGMRMALYKIPCPPDREDNDGYDNGRWTEEIQDFIKEKMRS